MAIARRSAIESVRVIFMERDASEFVVARLRARDKCKCLVLLFGRRNGSCALNMLFIGTA